VTTLAMSYLKDAVEELDLADSCRCDLERQLQIKESALNTEEIAYENAVAEADRYAKDISDSRINLDVIFTVIISISAKIMWALRRYARRS
jgi:hypothetical protein